MRPRSGGRFENVEFCLELDAYCARYGIDPWTFFVNEERWPWQVRKTVWYQAAKYRREQAPQPDEGGRAPETAEEVRAVGAAQAAAFEALEAVEGRGDAEFGG